MEHTFWQERWATNQIAFHEPEPHPFLRACLFKLGLEQGGTVFVPLCGKTLDIDWLLSKGFRVVGIELNQGAVEEVFERLSLTPERQTFGGLQRLQAGSLTLYIGDFFALTAAELGAVQGVFDRGSLVALPDELRRRYAPHLVSLAGQAPMLTMTYDYPQEQTPGPPFAIPFDQVAGLYAGTHVAERLESRAITGPLAQRCTGEEIALLLTPD
ncbi:MAG: thiopurine S-methyltransferase [Pseudomonadota bacterium]